MTTIEQLAEELHKFYRAATKAMNAEGGQCPRSDHDHGWSHCNKKKYFLRRAEQLKRDLDLDIITLHCGGCGKCLDCLRLERGNFGGTHIDPYPASLSTPEITKEDMI